MSSPGNQPPDKSPEEKLADALTKVLVFGGGSYGLWNLYLEDIPKAAISFGISLTTSLITSFGQPIIDKWKSGLKSSGEKTANALNEEFGKTTSKLLNRGFDKQYLEALKVQCDRIELEGFQNLQPLALDKVYVPLQIQTRDQLNLEGQKTIWDFLPKRYQTPKQSPHRRVVILAAPGYGKTTLMRHLTRTYAISPPEDTPQFIPVLLRLREIYGMLLGSEQVVQALSLSELIVEHIPKQRGCKNLKPSKHWFDQMLKEGKCLVLFDGLDEVPKAQRQSVRRWVDTQMQDYDNVQFILTSRPHGFDLRPDEPSHPIEIDTRLEVLKFNNPQKEIFINNWYRALYEREWVNNQQERGEQLEREWVNNQQERGEQLDPEQVSAHIDDEVEKSAADLRKQLFADIQLTAIASNPLLLTLIANTHRADTFLPKRRVELYERICNLFLGTRPYVKGNKLSLTATENKSLLQLLAWEMVQRESTQFTLTEATPWILEKLERFNNEQPVASNQFWEEIQDIAGLLVEKELGLYEFSHQTFQEYLAACHVKELGKAGEAILLENLGNDRWREVIYFYAAQQDATKLINALIDQFSQDNNTEFLVLADRCRMEGRELSSGVSQRLDHELALIRRQVTTSEPPPVSITFSVTEELPNVVDTPKVKPILSLAGNDDFLNNLDQREKFRQVIQLDSNIAIRQTLVSWGEFKLFLQDVSNGQFHATVKLSEQKHSVADETVQLPITWDEALWFCGWLSTQAEISPDKGTYHYRWPTREEWLKIHERFLLAPLTEGEEPLFSLAEEESRKAIHPLIQSADSPPNTLFIIREQVNSRYANLINYLANARWQEADKETEQVMLEVVSRKDQGYLDLGSIKAFPCEDLQLIEHLWLKFSGGHFGFSIQKEIYLQCGGKADYQHYEEAEQRWGEIVGWRENDSWTFNMRYDLVNSPRGHLPVQRQVTVFGRRVELGEDGEWGWKPLGQNIWPLLSHPDL